MNNIENKNIKELEEIICPKCKENMIIYYNKSNKIINNQQNRNYEILENIKEFNNIQKYIYQK